MIFARKFNDIRLLTLTLAALTVGVLFITEHNTSHAQRAFSSRETKADNLTGILGGRVFQDFNGNGLYDTSGGTAAAPTAVDTGVQNVRVRVFDSGGTQQGTTQTIANGTWAITATGIGPYRVEFTELPTGYSPSARSTDSVLGGTATNSGSTVQFVNNGNTANINLALNRPSDYCQNNPLLCAQLYGYGAGTEPNSVFTVPFSAGSTNTTGGLVTAFSDPGNTSLATSDDVGTTFGIAYKRSTRRIYVAAYMKKHTAFGPNGTGAIYQINRTNGNVSLYADLNTIFGANTAGANPHNTGDYDIDNGQATWDAVGKVAFGGMAISDDAANLFAMNLANRRIYRIPTSGPLSTTTIQSTAFPTTMPNCTNASDVRPFAVKEYQGTIYVGAVCSADVSDDRNILSAYVYTLNPSTLVFSAAPVFQTPLNYNRLEVDPGASANWLAWRTNFTSIATGNQFIYPQPMLTDIEFDRGNLILLIRDRNGDQTGYNNRSNPGNTNDTSKKGITAGDLLRACGTVGSWTIENNGRCGGIGNAPQNSNEGPGNGEYYYQDNYHPNGNPHDEVGLGSAVQLPGMNVLAATMFDPAYVPDGNIYDVGGLRWFVNSTGAQNRGYIAYSSGAPHFAKANGIGNVEALCDLAPIEIGNRVWRDTNVNGVQDPGEAAIAGVTVHLYSSTGVLLATAVTEANGEYYFVSGTSADPNPADNIGIVNGPLLPNAGYQIRFDNSADYTGSGPLTGLVATLANVATQNGDQDSNDSDSINTTNPTGSPAGTWPVISVTTGGAGANNHTFDAGFATRPTAANVSIEGRVYTRSGRSIRNALVRLTTEDGTVRSVRTGTFGFYRIEGVPAGNTAILDVTAPRYTFDTAAFVVSVTDNVVEANFVANDN